MTVRASQSFAALRQATIAELQVLIATDLLPKFNAECEDIRREYEATMARAASATEKENWGPLVVASAEARKKSRILEMNRKKNAFLSECNNILVEKMEAAVKKYEAEQFEEEESKEGQTKKVLKAKFPDGSMARIPRNLFIDYSAFARV